MRQAPNTNDTMRSRRVERPVAQLLDRQRHHVLHQVVGRVVVAQVALSVAAHARRKQPVQARLGLVARGARRRARDAARELGLEAVADGDGGLIHDAKHSQTPC